MRPSATYCETLSRRTPTLLVDTYNTLESGIPNAIRAFNEVLRPIGHHASAASVSTPAIWPISPSKARKMLDEAGWPELQDHRLQLAGRIPHHRDLLRQGALHRLVRRRRAAHHRQERAGVRRRVQARRRRGGPDGNIVPKIKVSENVGKITNPALQEGLPLLRPRERQGRWRTISACTTRPSDDSRAARDLSTRTTHWKRKTHHELPRRELHGPGVPRRASWSTICPSLERYPEALRRAARHALARGARGLTIRTGTTSISRTACGTSGMTFS